MVSDGGNESNWRACVKAARAGLNRVSLCLIQLINWRKPQYDIIDDTGGTGSRSSESQSDNEAPTARDAWHPEERHHRKRERGYWNWSLIFSGIAMGGAITAAFFTGSYVNASWRAIREAEIQSFILRDQEQRQLRAYIFLPPDNELHVVAYPSTKNTFEIDINVKNFGQTPAYQVITESWVNLAPWPPPGNFDYTGPLDPNRIFAYIIPPGGIVHFHAGSGRPFTQTEMTSLEDGALSLYIFGSITYEDAFGIKQHTDFCFASSTQDQLGFTTAIGVCPNHNDAT
jgi:hypothetical protein